MTSQSTSKSTLGSLLFIILFVIGCIFLYWTVEYWVYHNSDKGRYELVKIEGPGGVDTGSFWKLDRRAGLVQYCSLTTVVKNGVNAQELHCIAGTTEEERSREAAKLKSSVPVDQQAVETESVVTTTSTVPTPPNTPTIGSAEQQVAPPPPPAAQ